MLFQNLIDAAGALPIGRDASGDEINSIVYDSRKATRGALFVCLVGATFDGHSFVSDAYNRGCRAFFVDREIALPRDAAVYLVRDTRDALADISAEFFEHPEREIRLVGITGTKGKTTTAVMITNIMLALGENAGYIGSNGVNYAGRHFETANTTPESYELYRHLRDMCNAGVRVVALEVSSQALFKGRIRGLTFDLCIFTNLARDHIGPGEHPNFEHYRASKALLFEKYGATCILANADDSASEYMLRDASAKNIITYGTTDTAEVYADNILLSKREGVLGTDFDLHIRGCIATVSLAMPGKFNVINASAAILASIELVRRYGLAPEYASLADFSLLASVAGAVSAINVKGRFEVINSLPGRSFVIDYAHNGYSLEVVLRVLREYEPRRLICLLGSVGGRTFDRRAELGAVVSQLADICIVTSDNPNFESPIQIIDEICEAFVGNRCEAIKIDDREAAIKYAVENSRAGDIVLLAGKGHETYQLIRGEKHPFSEKDLILKYSANMAKTSLI